MPAKSLMEIFLEEAIDLITTIAILVDRWFLESGDKAPLVEIKRNLHTLKGGARMVHQIELSTLANELESLCEAILHDENPQHIKQYYHVFGDATDRLIECIESLKDMSTVATEDLHSLFIDAKQYRQKMPIIMIVDDSITVRTVTTNFLKRHQYQVVSANNGIDALEKIPQVKPDLVLLDLEMPGADGFEVAAKLRATDEFSTLPIIMITFCVGVSQELQAKYLGINHFVRKPYEAEALLRIINTLLAE